MSWAHLLNWVVCFLIVEFWGMLCILDNSLLSYMSFVNIYSQSVACLLILLALSFAEQKYLILMKSAWLILWIMPLVSCLKKYHYTQGHLDFLLMLSYRTFLVIHFIFRSVIHFKLFLWNVWGLYLDSFFLNGNIPLFQQHLLKRLSLLHCIVFTNSSKISWLYLLGPISGLSILNLFFKEKIRPMLGCQFFFFFTSFFLVKFFWSDNNMREAYWVLPPFQKTNNILTSKE